MSKPCQILEFPFRMNWMATNAGGRKLLEIYWETVAGLNEIAISGHQMQSHHWEMIADLNKMFEPWGLPTFPTQHGETLPLFESTILPFSAR